MDKNQLLEAVTYRATKVREIAKAVEKLNSSTALEEFCNNNVFSNISYTGVADYLMVIAAKMIDKRISLDIVKNIYDEYSVIFVCCMFGLGNDNPAIKNKLNKMFINIISNSSKFDMFTKNKLDGNNKRISSDNFIIELFWLIPLFVNVSVLTSMDYMDFIEENQNIGNKVEGYIEGWKFYATNEIMLLDKPAFKTFMQEGVVSLAMNFKQPE